MVVVYDIETLKGAFTYTAIDVKTKEIYQYVIHKERNDLNELIYHIMGQTKGMIGYNNISFDYPVIHYICNNYSTWLAKEFTVDTIIKLIYSKAQDVIDNARKAPLNNYIAPNNMLVPQLDLFKMWHLDNKAKLTSLKALEISMNYPNVMDMPIDHKTETISADDVTSILEYNLNDVLATLAFYEKSKKKIELRKTLLKQYGLPCLSWNNGKIGEQLLLKFYCEKVDKKPYQVKNLRSKRDHINLKDCIPSNVKFTTDIFKHLLEYFRTKTIKETKNSIEYYLYHNNVKLVYGTGGIHGSIEPGIYEEDANYMIIDADVASLYPNLAIVLGIYPEHLGPEFFTVYKEKIVDVRMAEKAKPKDKQDSGIIDGFKEAANIPYGKSNEETSFMYDPLYTMKTTIAGQLYISMLIEKLTDIEGCTLLQANTDGITVKIPRKSKFMYDTFCKSWELLTGLTLEFAEYKKMWIADVNNYGAVTVTGKIKNKGRFEVDKKLGDEPAYHKDNSFRIIPLALEQYFTHGVPVETTILSHTNIYDFCGRQKFKGKDNGVIKHVEGGILITMYQQKNVRYYVSNKGGAFFKRYGKDNSEEAINKGFTVKTFNVYVDKPIKEYDINYNFYIRECNKEINIINNKQLELNV